MTENLPELRLTAEHLHLTEADAERLLEGRLRRGERVMDPKAQVVGEVIKQLRSPDALPTPQESRGQFRKMVELLDEPRRLRSPFPTWPAPVRRDRYRCGSMRPRARDPVPCCCISTAEDGSRGLGNPSRRLREAGRLVRMPGPCRRLPAGARAQVSGWAGGLPGGMALARRKRGHARRRPGAAGGRRRFRGGNLAAAVCQILSAGGEPGPAAQLLIYPSLDLGWQLPSHRELADAYILPRIRVRWYTELYLSAPEQAADVRVSPLGPRPAGAAPGHGRHGRLRSAAR